MYTYVGAHYVTSRAAALSSSFAMYVMFGRKFICWAEKGVGVIFYSF